MGSKFERILTPVQDVFSTIRTLRAPIIISVLALFILSKPNQVLELYLLLARDWLRLLPQLILAIGSLVSLCVFLIYVSRELTRSAGAPDAEVHVQSRLRRALPIILGLLPLLGAAMGLHAALDRATTPKMRSIMAVLDTLKSETAFASAKKGIEDFYKKNDPTSERTRVMLQGLNLKQSTYDELSRSVKKVVPDTLLEIRDKNAALTSRIYAAIGVCAAFALLLILMFGSKPLSPTLRTDFLGTKVFRPAVRYMFYFQALALIALFAAQTLNTGRKYDFDFTAIPRALGTLALVNVCLVILVFFCSLLTRTQERYKVPLLTLLFVAALAFSAFNLNDNHDIRLLAVSPEEAKQRGFDTAPGDKTQRMQDLEAAFSDWMLGRPAAYAAKFDNDHYPVYLIAAQGGGMYAANLSGLFLARLFDRCPAMRNHVFAISGVSGGSVGAGIFSALLNDPATGELSNTCNLKSEPAGAGRGPLESKVAELLRADYLSPVAASFLFPDLVQRFLPYPFEALDRARAFEAGLEQAWDHATGSKNNPLREPFWKHWRPDGQSPMLLLNTTVAETGRQLAISPVRLWTYSDQGSSRKSQHADSLHEGLGIDATWDVPLSTAMSLSARFPIVMPAGSIAGNNAYYRLVDGGYFENSASEMAIAVANRLRNEMDCNDIFCRFKNPRWEKLIGKRVIFHVIILSDYDFQTQKPKRTLDDRSGLGEVLSPLQAMYNSRVARGDMAVTREVPGLLISPMALNHQLYELPLGWQISSEVQDIIGAQIGEHTRCVSTTGPNSLLTDRVFALETIEIGSRDMKSPKNISDEPGAIGGALEGLDFNNCIFHRSGISTVDAKVNAAP